MLFPSSGAIKEAENAIKKGEGELKKLMSNQEKHGTYREKACLFSTTWENEHFKDTISNRRWRPADTLSPHESLSPPSPMRVAVIRVLGCVYGTSLARTVIGQQLASTNCSIVRYSCSYREDRIVPFNTVRYRARSAVFVRTDAEICGRGARVEVRSFYN